ncbi:hypothetical protein SAMN04488066_101236 [Halorubrum aquaticum]|uniref:Uncharacterized protein n=1 Tax=Halorubrum aquaticum TaxID=387340 RepID=A0A1I2Z4V9_9EURY|nr:hypothetical protein [Halorubrum aquaticum]SFH32903.1 hypothetical protein SAMN04488066_101236 [Halorubrum aquaticum]
MTETTPETVTDPPSDPDGGGAHRQHASADVAPELFEPGVDR